MSADSIKKPSRAALLLAGGVVLAAAVVVVVSGVITRAHAERELAAQTLAAAIPDVALAKVEAGGIPGPLTLPGTVAAFNQAPIYARVSGYLKSWSADIGTHVAAGQSLALIDTPDLDQQLDHAKANLAMARANEQLATITARRWQKLVSSQSVSQQDADQRSSDAAARHAQTEAAQAELRRIETLERFKNIVAPFAGVVTARNTDIGALINAGGTSSKPLFVVEDQQRVRIYVDVPQAFIARIQPGQQAEIAMPQYPGQEFPATVAHIARAVNPMTRSMQVELQADNPKGLFTPGTYARVEFSLPPDPHVVRLPATALIVGNRTIAVATLGPNDRVAMKTIQLGRDGGDFVEVVSGLGPDARVIDSPPESLLQGQEVHVVRQPSQPTPTAKAS